MVEWMLLFFCFGTLIIASIATSSAIPISRSPYSAAYQRAMDETERAGRVQVCYYITGHGLGHATRALELIQYLLASNAFDVHVVTKVKKDFFIQGLRDCGLPKAAYGADRFTHTERVIDTGAVQSDVFTVDPIATLRQYNEVIHQHREEMLQKEVDWLRSRSVRLVLVDASPLGCRAGAGAGAKVILLSNFSWDFCFDGMLQMLRSDVGRRVDDSTLAQLQAMVHQCAKDSAACSLYLQLPGQTPLPEGTHHSMTVTMKPGPLIVRPMRHLHSPLPYYRCSNEVEYNAFVQEMRREFHVPQNTKVLLLGFGGHSTQWQLEDAFLPPDWICFTLGATEADMPSDRFRAVPFDSCYVPNLIALADAVLGKIGYGFVSECIHAGTVLCFVPRSHWPEELYLRRLLCEEYPAGICLPKEDFITGNWEKYLEEAAVRKGTWQISDVHNASTALEVIIDHCKQILS